MLFKMQIYEKKSNRMQKYEKKQKALMVSAFLLSYLDSNQDKLIQSQMCYRYTIGQSVFFFRKRVQKYNLFPNWQNFF